MTLFSSPMCIFFCIFCRLVIIVYSVQFLSKWKLIKSLQLKMFIILIFARFWQILHIICDVINFIATILKFFFGHFVYNMTRYYCAKFYIKSIFLSGFMQGAQCAPRGFIRPKKPGATRGNKLFGEDFFYAEIIFADLGIFNKIYFAKWGNLKPLIRKYVLRKSLFSNI